MMEVVINLMMTVVIMVEVMVMVTMPYVQEHAHQQPGAPHQWPSTFEWSRTKQRSWELDRPSWSDQRIGKRPEQRKWHKLA